MANRVILGELPGGGQGLRVSRPGFNALSTSLTGKQLAFDSRWPTSARVLISGTITPAQGNGMQWVNYGRTFDTLPTVLTFGMDQEGYSWDNPSFAPFGYLPDIIIERSRVGFRRFPNTSRQFGYIVLLT